MKVEVNVSHIYSSPEHHYFTREKFDVGNAITYELSSIDLEPQRGIKGDRFEFSTFPITFVSEEVMRDVFKTLDLVYNPQLFRRNIVISGINLNQLIGKAFALGDVCFEGLEYCSPCIWMNAVMKKGAYRLMSGRGGLRARVVKKGLFKTGANILITENDFELLDPLERKKRPRIP